MSRNGKIARLPREAREELNRRLDDHEDGAQLLEWLNQLPEVKKAVDGDFGGVPISKQNLYQWRQGGFREWRLQRDLHEEARELSEGVRELEDSVDPPVLAGDLATVLAARYAAVLRTWDGEPGKEIEARLRLLRLLCQDIALLQRTMHRATGQRNEFERQLKEEEEQEIQDEKHELLKPIWALSSVARLTEAFGGGEKGLKLAKLVTAVEYDQPIPEFDKDAPKEAVRSKAPNRAKPGNTCSRRKRRRRRAAEAQAKVPCPEAGAEAQGNKESCEAPDPVTPGNTQ